MIVKMKKTSLVVLDSEVEDSMEKLRDAGIMHLDLSSDENDRISALLGKKVLLEKAISVLPIFEKTDKIHKKKDLDDILELADRIQDLSSRESVYKEEISILDRDIKKLLPWGSFDFSDIALLKEKGLDIKLYELNTDQFNSLPENRNIFVINRTKSIIRFAIVLTKGEDPNISYEEVLLPEQPLSELQLQFKNKKNEIESIQKELEDLSLYRNDFEHALKEIDTYLEFEYAVNSMNKEEKVAYLTGFIPDVEINHLRYSNFFHESLADA